MSGGHHRPRPDPHRSVALVPAQTAVVGTLLFVLSVVATPREAVWALVGQGLVLVAVARAVGVPLRLLGRRLGVVVPFVAFALVLPVVAAGPRTDVLGLSLSTNGLWAAWNIVAKAALGVGATTVLIATTPVPAILGGLDRLRVPRPLTAIAGFMLRYGDLLVDETRRMRIARRCRGYDPRWFWEARAVATSAGTLFLRSYERGERVHLAMQARGFTGTMPPSPGDDAHGMDWAVALLPGAAAAALAIAGWGWT